MSKHTKGPWLWDVIPHELRADDDQGTVILRCRDNEPSNADARLIATAPELVRELRSSTNELKMALSLIEDAITQDAISLQIRDNKQAIAKVEGK